MTRQTTAVPNSLSEAPGCGADDGGVNDDAGDYHGNVDCNEAGDGDGRDVEWKGTDDIGGDTAESSSPTSRDWSNVPPTIRRIVFS